MKTCTECGISKAVGEFFLQDSAKGKLHAQCKQCYKTRRKLYHAEHYKKYGDIYRTRARVRKARIKTELRGKLLEYLTNLSCVVCSESDIRVLDFDHLDPATKTFGISISISKCYSWDVIETEIKKCRILCANCHRKHTANQQSWYKNL